MGIMAASYMAYPSATCPTLNFSTLEPTEPLRTTFPVVPSILTEGAETAQESQPLYLTPLSGTLLSPFIERNCRMEVEAFTSHIYTPGPWATFMAFLSLISMSLKWV